MSGRVRLALAAILAGLLIMAVGAAPASREPAPAGTWRPATDEERRQRDRELLHEELDRIWEQQR